MRKRFRAGRGQATIEFAILVSALAAALVFICVYGGRAVQGKIKLGADTLSEVHYEEGKTTIVNR